MWILKPLKKGPFKTWRRVAVDARRLLVSIHSSFIFLDAHLVAVLRSLGFGKGGDWLQITRYNNFFPKPSKPPGETKHRNMFSLAKNGGAFSLLESETCTFTEGGLRCSWRCVRLWNPPPIMSPPVSKRLVCQKSSIEKSDIWKSCVHPQVRLVTHLLGMDPAARSPPQPLELSKARLPLPAGILENFHQEKMLKEWSIVESKWETCGKFWLKPEPWWIFCKAGGVLRQILAAFWGW